MIMKISPDRINPLIAGADVAGVDPGNLLPSRTPPCC